MLDRCGFAYYCFTGTTIYLRMPGEGFGDRRYYLDLLECILEQRYYSSAGRLYV